jgi:hypothetical protein
MFSVGQRVRVTRYLGIVSLGEVGTVVKVRPGSIPGHTDLLVQFDKDTARNLGPMDLDAQAWAPYLEIVNG